MPVNHEFDWFLITSEEMNILRKSEAQIIWGVFSAIPKELNFEVDESSLPYADGSQDIWGNGNFQVEESVIEIIAWDSSYTIIKFKNKELSDRFRDYFDEAVELEQFK